ncbi:MAG: hypothetical protein KDA64_03960 [Rhodospirillaceae bacterium]|nr:hypothetical protein [Rhodospirillaceae bacterium]
MTTASLRYPTGNLVADYGRGALGLGISGAVLLLVDAAPLVFWTFALFGAVSAWFLGRTLLRHLSAFGHDADAVWQTGPLGRRIAWEELSALRLKFFSTRRDRSAGWMHLTLSGRRTTLRVESALDGFEELVARAFDAAKARDLALSDATLANLMALGIDPQPEEDSLAVRWGITGGALHDPRAGTGG